LIAVIGPSNLRNGTRNVIGLVEKNLSQFLWRTRYRDSDARPAEADITDTWKRVARSVAAIEHDPALWCEQFLGILRGFAFLPGGRILAGAGTMRQVTLFNCFVMGVIDDSVAGIFEALKEGALTMQQGGGVGYDFSTLRPHGSRAHNSGMVASGPVSFMRIWDAMCATILSTGARRGAMMATLRCDHPDIEEFIDSKRTADSLQRFNLSVLVTDAFMQAMKDDTDWPLIFPGCELEGSADGGLIERTWSGSATPVACRIWKVLRARKLWGHLCESAHDCAEPGVIFIDRINADNNLAYCESLSATNPCAEEPLPPYGACNLGSLNLPTFVKDAFTPAAHLDHEGILETVRLAVRFLDDVIEISRFPLFRQREQAHRSRRIGLGVTGLADALAMLSLRYDSEPARAAATGLMRRIRDASYRASVELAREKGPCAAYDAELYLDRPFIRRLPAEIREAISRHGIRNSHLLAIAPAGTISLLAGNVSSGIEPIFGLESLRRVLDSDGVHHNFQVTDYAYAAWRGRQEEQTAGLPHCFIDREAIAPRDHLLMQAALQPYVDGAISKTIALSRRLDKAVVAEIFQTAYDLGLKGCTVFRESARPGVIVDPYLTDPAREAERSSAHCCDSDRESD
jgi:ribonucleoside-diphosphate reductase alpha chain